MAGRFASRRILASLESASSEGRAAASTRTGFLVGTEISVSPFQPIFSGPCNLCQINQGKKYLRVNHDVSSTATRRGAQVHDAHPRPDQALGPVEFLELEGRAGTPTLALGTLHIGVVEMLLEPAPAGLAAPHHRTPPPGPARQTYNRADMALTQNDRKQLRRLGHPLQPIVMIGQHGLTPAIVSEMDLALTAHELVKARARVGDRALRSDVLSALAEKTASDLVQTIGNIGLFYRKNKILQRILLPDS